MGPPGGRGRSFSERAYFVPGCFHAIPRLWDVTKIESFRYFEDIRVGHREGERMEWDGGRGGGQNLLTHRVFFGRNARINRPQSTERQSRCTYLPELCIFPPTSCLAHNLYALRELEALLFFVR